nr:MAG TPA: hypothetical protein [Caudoviricetes sp.]
MEPQRKSGDWKAVAAIVFYAAVIVMIAAIIINQLRGGSNGDDLPNTGITMEEIRMENIDLTPMSFGDWLEAVCGIYEVDPALVRAIIELESAGQPDAVNPKTGAMGLMQIVPATWDAQVAEMHLYFGTTPETNPMDPLDPYDNVRVGLWLLSHLLRKYPDAHPYALDCYAMGEAGAMERLLKLPDYTPCAWTQKVLVAAQDKIDKRAAGEAYMAASPENK